MRSANVESETDTRRFRRRSIRLPEFDYAQPGAYFVTLCAHRKRNLFGEMSGVRVKLNAQGQVVRRCWKEIPRHFPNVRLDAFAIMPNHLHGIVVIRKRVGAQHAAPLREDAPYRPPIDCGGRVNVERASLAAVIRSFKAATTKRIRSIRRSTVDPVWQRNY